MALTFKSLKDYEAWKAQARARYGTPAPDAPEVESSEPEASPPTPAKIPPVKVQARRVSPVTAKRQAPPDSRPMPFWLEAALIAAVTLVGSLFWQK